MNSLHFGFQFQLFEYIIFRFFFNVEPGYPSFYENIIRISSEVHANTTFLHNILIQMTHEVVLSELHQGQKFVTLLVHSAF